MHLEKRLLEARGERVNWSPKDILTSCVFWLRKKEKRLPIRDFCKLYGRITLRIPTACVRDVLPATSLTCCFEAFINFFGSP